MFAQIAGRYDLANHLLSFGLDFYWRNRLVRTVKQCHPRIVVDLATGSGDVAFALKRSLGAEVKVTGMDFCPPMLARAEQKRNAKSDLEDVILASGDCLNLPLADDTVDAITIAFGIRNLEDRNRGLKETLRVLKKPTGSLFILEFSQPMILFKPFYFFYLRFFLPRIAGLATGRPEAYRYLVNSIAEFPTRQSLSEELLTAGFSQVVAQPLSLSTTAIHHARV